MREDEFRTWLLELDSMREESAEIRIANAKTVESAFGSLDDHYLKDGGKELLELFTYSKNDMNRNFPPNHGLEFSGDIYSKTSNLKHSIKRYMEFRESEKFKSD